MSDHDQLLVIVDPVARRSDGESVRIAKDVLCAAAETKICLPDSPEEFTRALARRGSRRPVVVGDDRALLRTVTLLHRERELAQGALSVVPIGAPGSLEVARSLGVPPGAVAAARTVVDGVARRLDLLVDDGDGVVLGGVRIPATPGPAAVAAPPPATMWDTCRTLVRTLVRTVPAQGGLRTHRLRVEADGVLLSDVDEPVEAVTVRSLGGIAEVVVRPPHAPPLRAEARTLTVSGPDFRYHADSRTSPLVRARTWTVREGAWSLTLPPVPAGAGEVWGGTPDRP
ncbi:MULTISPECIES: diacylglycerol kinase [Streptomyces]|uniref:Diacylglycerol kinase n=1 Tax=Streptomyces solicathayae TaxID=3081768 RepID=A0ABZ0LUF2_9ACTN|nr:diacylglycerol kinase [Streptomyces sp. HUAS YS2]WOX23047.1 diacylglycerol kinase [Streptomyces sp. HUAS YS2]